MKKILTILLVAVLAVGFAFAGFTGSATIGAGVDFDTKAYGFIGNGQSITVNLSMNQAIGGSTGEGDIYAAINGTVDLAFDTAAAGPASIDNGWANVLMISASITDAGVYGKDWSVMYGPSSPKNFASDSIDSYTQKAWGYDVNDWGYALAKVTGHPGYTLGYNPYDANALDGVDVTVKDFSFGGGIKGSYADGAAKPYLLGYFYTPDFAIADGMTLTAGVAAYNLGSGKNAAGGSLKFAYDSDNLNATVATDMGISDLTNNKVFGIDVAANVEFAPVTIDAYYKNLESGYTHKPSNDAKQYAGKNLLSAKVVADLSGFDVPVKLTVTAKDVINAQNLSLSADATLGNIELVVSGGYKFNKVKADYTYEAANAWSAGADVTYTAEKFTANGGATIGATVGTDDSFYLYPYANISSDAIISGASLQLAWADFNGGDIDILNGKYGSLMASCTIAF